MKLLFSIFFLIFTFVVGSYAQDERAKVAEAYEQSGDYRNAARLWQELYSANAQNESYFNGVVRSLKALNNYVSLVDIVKERVQRRRTLKNLALYGQVLYKAGRVTEAQQAWNEALAIQPTSAETYREVAASQIEIRLVDETMNTFRTARERVGNQTVFADELAQLYAAKSDYKNGISEVLNAFEVNKNQQVAQGRLSALMVNDTATRYVCDQVQSAAESNSNDLSYLRLYSWLMRETKQYDKSYDVVRRIDKITRADGRELLAFGDQARNDGQQDVAIKAYSTIIDLGKSNQYSQYAYYGYVRALEDKIAQTPDNANEALNQIIGRYRDLIADYPGTNIAAEAQYHIAKLYSDNLNNSEKAISEYNELLKTYAYFPPAGDGVIELGSTYLKQDNLAKASELYSRAAYELSNRFPMIKEKAVFMMGELFFYKTEFDSARSYYELLAGKTESEYANDAIERVTTINLNRQDSSLLKDYALAQLRAFQKRYDEAMNLYKSIYSSKQNQDLAELALYRAGEMLYNKRDYNGCRQMFAKLAELNSETIYGDRVLLMTAYSYSAEGNKAEAVRYLQDLLAKFPRSILLQEAREKVRKLRGDMQ